MAKVLSGTVEESWARARHLPDGTWRVTVSLGGSPLHATLALEERTHGTTRRLVCFQVVVEPTEGAGADDVSGAGLREAAKNFEKMQQVAVAAVGAHSEGAGARLAPGVRGRRELSPSFLRDVVRRHAEYRDQGQSPVAALAREEQVSPRTVQHWLTRAREAGIEGAS
jgi:hypothetical protein